MNMETTMKTSKTIKGDEDKELSGESAEPPRPAQVRRIYVGRLGCGCAVAATIDADDLAEMARDGYFIETVDAAYVQIAGCQCGQPLS